MNGSDEKLKTFNFVTNNEAHKSAGLQLVLLHF